MGPWKIVLVSAACALLPDGIAGQTPPPLQNPVESKRPRLSSAADTNDWEAYFDYGVSRLRSDPRGAERAFYWASRLEPSRSEPPYGRWVAYWMRFPGWFEEYVEERPRVLESPNIIQVDSLYQRALFRNPLTPRTLHILLYDQLPGRWGRDPLTVAVLDYGAGRFEVAAREVGKLIRDDPVKHYRLRYWHALCFTATQRQALAQAGRHDEADLQLRKVIELEPLFAPPYYTLGTVLEARGLPVQARAAYSDYVQRAPSLAPLVPRARARMAELNGATGDSGRRP